MDELSRAAPSMQSKWLEVIRSRRAMGRPIDGLRHVFAAMNPPGYLGARPLDAALAGRFGFLVRMPTVREMDARQLAAVIRTVSAADAPASRDVWAEARPGRATGQVGDIPAALLALPRDPRARLPGVVAEHGAGLVDYVRTFQALLRAHEVHLDGRRLALMYRALCAGVAVEAARGRPRMDRPMLDALVPHLLPGVALDQPLEPAVLLPALAATWEQGHEARGGVDACSARAAAWRVLAQPDLPSMLDAYEGVIGLLSEEQHHEVASRVLRPLSGEDRAGPEGRRRMEALAALGRLVRIVSRSREGVPMDVAARVLETWRAASGQGCLTWMDVAGLVAEKWGDPEFLDRYVREPESALWALGHELLRRLRGDIGRPVDLDGATWASLNLALDAFGDAHLERLWFDGEGAPICRRLYRPNAFPELLALPGPAALPRSASDRRGERDPDLLRPRR